MIPAQLLFLPGATGNSGFWQPVASLLSHRATPVLMTYAGFGATPADPAVDSFDDLVDHVVARIDKPTALVAQSIGGVLALAAALESPLLITHLVLTVTSGGIDTKALGAKDWRTDFAAAYPQLPRWLLDFSADLSRRLPAVKAPTLLLWGDDDPLSPVSVGGRLQALLPNASLHVLPGGKHDLAYAMADRVAPLIVEHIFRGP
ncbi:MAG: alpha/beta fold hydrolase [Pseudomonadota bacterium]